MNHPFWDTPIFGKTHMFPLLVAVGGVFFFWPWMVEDSKIDGLGMEGM